MPDTQFEHDLQVMFEAMYMAGRIERIILESGAKEENISTDFVNTINEFLGDYLDYCGYADDAVKLFMAERINSVMVLAMKNLEDFSTAVKKAMEDTGNSGEGTGGAPDGTTIQ